MKLKPELNTNHIELKLERTTQHISYGLVCPHLEKPLTYAEASVSVDGFPKASLYLPILRQDQQPPAGRWHSTYNRDLIKYKKMPTNISKLTLNASAEKVWDALTNPEKVKAWQYGSELKTDWKVGNEIRFKSEWEGQIFEQWGTVMEFNPFRNLKYNLFAPRPDLEDKPENYFEMEYILTEKDIGTELQIIQKDNRKGAKQEEEQGEENPVLKNLKSLIESDLR